VPVQAAKAAFAATVATPSPPLMRPTRRAATSNVSRPMPVTETRRPMRTNSGMTANTSEAIEVAAELASSLPAMTDPLIAQTPTKDRNMSATATCMPVWISTRQPIMHRAPISVELTASSAPAAEGLGERTLGQQQILHDRRQGAEDDRDHERPDGDLDHARGALVVAALVIRAEDRHDKPRDEQQEPGPDDMAQAVERLRDARTVQTDRRHDQVVRDMPILTQGVGELKNDHRDDG